MLVWLIPLLACHVFETVAIDCAAGEPCAIVEADADTDTDADTDVDTGDVVAPVKGFVVSMTVDDVHTVGVYDAQGALLEELAAPGSGPVAYDAGTGTVFLATGAEFHRLTADGLDSVETSATLLDVEFVGGRGWVAIADNVVSIDDIATVGLEGLSPSPAFATDPGTVTAIGPGGSGVYATVLADDGAPDLFDVAVGAATEKSLGFDSSGARARSVFAGPDGEPYTCSSAGAVYRVADLEAGQREPVVFYGGGLNDVTECAWDEGDGSWLVVSPKGGVVRLDAQGRGTVLFAPPVDHALTRGNFHSSGVPMPRALRALAGPAALLVLEGCKGCAEADALPEHLVPIEAVATGVWVADAVAAGDVAVPIATVSAAGAATASADAVAVASTGSLESGSVTVDGEGWGEARLVEPAAGGYAVDATTTTGTDSGSAWSVRAQPGLLDWRAWAPAAAASHAAVAGRGAVWASGEEVWWAPAAGGTPLRVATMGGTVDGLLAVQADNDGVTDLLVWSASRVALLRGRDAGGLFHGAAWNADVNATIAAATVADQNDDSFADLVVLTTVDGVGAVSVLTGDGVWGYTLTDVLELDFVAYGLSVEDLNLDGDSEVTVLTEDGLLRRFARFEEGWGGTTVNTDLDVGIGLGGRLWPAADVEGDGIPDLLVSGPLLNGDGMQAWVVTAGGERQILYKMFDDTIEMPSTLGVAVIDLTGDGLVDLALNSEVGLARAAWTVRTDDDGSDLSGFLKQTWTGVPDGAVGAGDLDGDGIPDLVIGGEHVLVVPGARTADDTATEDDETVVWEPAETTADHLGTGNLLDPVVGDWSGDGIVDLALFAARETTLVVRGYVGTPATDAAAETLTYVDEATIVPGTALDRAACDGRVWLLLADEAGAVGLWAVDLDAGVAPTVALGPLAVAGGERVACGTFADGDAAVVSSDGVVTYVAADGTAVQGAETLQGVVGLAAADEDGDGIDSLAWCGDAGCRVVAGDLDGDGMDEVVTSDADGVTVGADVALTGGAPVIADADGDGVDDLVLADAGMLRVLRFFDGLPAPAGATFVWRPVTDAAAYGDLSGDGVPDAFLFGAPAADDAADDWTGVLLYARAR